MERSTMKKSDFILIVGILLIALLVGGFFLLQKGDHAGVASLSIDGNIVALYDLSQTENGFIDLREEYGTPVILEVKDQAIRFYESVCPDHICENYGFISRETETAVCLPNRTVLTIHSPNDEIPLEKSVRQ